MRLKTQRDYLQALGIEQWLLKKQPPMATAPDSLHSNQKTSNTRTSAIAQMDWDSLQAAVAQCQACSLYATRTQAVFGVGRRDADLLVVGEAPGANEDKQGEPFVGRGGQLLNAMLNAIGLSRDTIYIANILKSRPPGNRDPKASEVAACTPFLLRQIALIQPKIILALGRIAAQTLLNTAAPMARLRGQLFKYEATQTPLLVSYHPAYLLRAPREKRKTWEDLKLLKTWLNDH